MTKGWLPPGKSYDWHMHKDIDEIFIVLTGQGQFYYTGEATDDTVGDIYCYSCQCQTQNNCGGEDNKRILFCASESMILLS